MSESNEEISPFKPRADYDDTFPFRGEYAHIQFSFENLRRDTVREAVEQGVSQSDATAFMEKVNFFVESQNSYLGRKFSRKDKIRMKLAKTLKTFPDLLGAVDIENLNRPECFLNIEKIVNITNSSERIQPNVKIPTDAPLEAREAALKLTIDSVWRHERQHLIQLMGSEKRKIMEDELARTSRKISRVRKTALALGSSGASLGIISQFFPETRELELLPPASLLLVGLGYLTIAGGMQIRDSAYMGSEHEKESYDKQGEDSNRPTPISLSFESK